MNKVLKGVIIFSVIIIVAWVVGRLTNMLQWYRTSNIANYPTIKSPDLFFASNLRTPQKCDFICYNSNTPEFGKQLWIHRICGMEGDTIEIKDGVLFVNKQNADSALTLSHDYTVDKNEVDKLKAQGYIDEADIQYTPSDSAIIYVDDKIWKEHLVSGRRMFIPKDYTDETIKAKYGQSWNQDNFGPVIVPKGKYFVLGDNRMHSQDSRYTGFIDKADYISTVLGR